MELSPAMIVTRPDAATLPADPETTGCTMPDRSIPRRSVLALMASLLGLPLTGTAAAFVAPDLTHPEIRRWGRHYIVNGWVLTSRDLDRLGLDA
jgi:hypothetical protein